MKSIDVFMLALIEHVKDRTNAMLVALQTNPAFNTQTNPAFKYPFRIMLEVRAEGVSSKTSLFLSRNYLCHS